MNRHPLALGLLLLVPVLHPADARAAQPNLDSLVQNSPFGGAAAAAGGARADTPLEFRSVIVEGGESFFSIYEAASRSSLWVAVNEPGNPYKVQAYDSVKGVLTVEYKGTVVTLPLKQAKILALAPTAPAGPGQPGGPVGVGPAGAANVTEANPAGDPAKMIEEIRRRRALRQQATQAGGPVPGPAPNPNAAPALPIPKRN